jgi:hypothetical protein
LVEERYDNIRANVTFHGLDARNRGRVQVSAELPLLYPLGRSKNCPRSSTPTRRQTQHGATRAGKLEDKPYLDSLPVYRYLPKYR